LIRTINGLKLDPFLFLFGQGKHYLAAGIDYSFFVFADGLFAWLTIIIFLIFFVKNQLFKVSSSMTPSKAHQSLYNIIARFLSGHPDSQLFAAVESTGGKLHFVPGFAHWRQVNVLTRQEIQYGPYGESL
jgi:hypothetical protein